MSRSYNVYTLMISVEENKECDIKVISALYCGKELLFYKDDKIWKEETEELSMKLKCDRALLHTILKNDKLNEAYQQIGAYKSIAKEILKEENTDKTIYRLTVLV